MGKLSRIYKEADVIHLVMDNYCTHTQKALIEFYGKEKGNKIWNRFVIHYTPRMRVGWIKQRSL